MNYYQYQRRVPQRKKTDYIKPLIIAIFFIAILFGLWKLLGMLFGGGGQDETNLAAIQVEVESGDASVQTSGSEDWKTITANSLDIYEGEGVQTSSDGRVTLTFSDESIIRLDKNSELSVEAMSENGAVLPFTDGKLWLDSTNGTGTTLTLNTKYLEVVAETGSRFSLTAPGDLYVISGDVTVNVLDGKKTVDTLTVNADQQLSVTQSIIDDLSEGLEKDILFALDEDFEKSSWYQWNAQKDGLDTRSNEEEVNEDEATSDEEENQDEEETTDEEENTDGPTTPKITEPGSNGDEVTLDSTEEYIKGTVDSSTVAVVVNGYQLQAFKKGNTTFTYRANTNIGNLKVGENTYKVIAKDEDGNESEAATITLILPKDLDNSDNVEEDNNDQEPTGDVAFTAPNGGSDLTTSDTAFVLSGTVPTNTSKVLINGYQLQAYSAGTTTFKYNANTTFNTLQANQANTYKVEAYDADGNLIGSDTLTITHQANSQPQEEVNNQNNNEALSLSITLPTTSANYETTLNQITLGGTVSSSAEAIYINNQKIAFTPGSTEWSYTVNLEAGKNTFNVFAESAGQKLLLDSINVVYN